MIVFKQQGKIRKVSIFSSTVDIIPPPTNSPPFLADFFDRQKSVLREITKYCDITLIPTPFFEKKCPWWGAGISMISTVSNILKILARAFQLFCDQKACRTVILEIEKRGEKTYGGGGWVIGGKILLGW